MGKKSCLNCEFENSILKLFFSVFIFFFTFQMLSQNLWAVSGDTFGFHGYVRAGVGAQAEGESGGDLCVTNPGAGSNEFRLGNECGVYSELSFLAHHKKASKEDKSFFYSKYTLAFARDGHVDWEDGDVAFREIYAEGGAFNDSPLTYWVGKRFYRENDIFMNDYYYFADLSGNGGGVGNIPIGIGNLHVAWMRQVNSGKDDPTTDKGRLAMNVLDFRIKDVKVTDSSALKLWFALSKTTVGFDETNSKTYDSLSGLASGVLLEQGFSKGFHHVGVMYGQGAMDDLNLYFSVKAQEDGGFEAQEKANRIRLVDHLSYQPSSRWAFFTAAVAEVRDSGADTDYQESWYSLGFRPTYFLSKNYQLVGQLGHSIVQKDTEKDRTLSRVSFGPQVALSDGVWARPTLSLIATYNFYNSANREKLTADKGTEVTDGLTLQMRMEAFF